MPNKLAPIYNPLLDLLALVTLSSCLTQVEVLCRSSAVILLRIKILEKAASRSKRLLAKALRQRVVEGSTTLTSLGRRELVCTYDTPHKADIPG